MNVHGPTGADDEPRFELPPVPVESDHARAAPSPRVGEVVFDHRVADRDTVGRAVRTGFADAGRPLVRALEVLGGHLMLLGRALAALIRPPLRLRNHLEAMVYVGYQSLPIVLLVAAFTGMVMSLQLVNAFGQFGLKSVAGGATGKAIALELGPVLTSLVLAGRAGAGIATELGTMRISEQLDALKSMGVDPVQFLVTPRLIASMIVTPILTLLFFIVAMVGAYAVAVILLDVDAGQWIANTRDIVTLRDVTQGVIKAVVFGAVLALVGCYQGLNATGGGRGVGIGTTRAVVIASVSTLVLDYFLSDVLLGLLGTTADGA